MSEYIYEHKPSGADHMGKPVELPTLVQREKIVRCRDCRYYELVPEDSGDWCEYWTDRVYRADGLCSSGERKVDE